MAAHIHFNSALVRPEIRALADRPERVTLPEWRTLRANGHERLLLYSRLDDGALAWVLETCASSYAAPFGTRRVPTTYPDLALCVLAPTLVARLRERRQMAEQPQQVAEAGALTRAQLVAACANVGVDLTCGACAAVFYTGAAAGLPHDEGCKSVGPRLVSAREALGRSRQRRIAEKTARGVSDAAD